MGKISYIFICLTFLSFGQEEFLPESGSIRTTLTFSLSKSLVRNSSYFYLDGQLETYLNKSISIAGESYYLLNNIKGKSNEYDMNHSLHFGINKHFYINNFDFFIGFQPGLTLTKVSYPENIFYVWDNRKISYNPALSLVAGLNFYFSKYCHFFIHSRLLVANNFTNYERNISDIRINGGLAFHLHRKK